MHVQSLNELELNGRAARSSMIHEQTITGSLEAPIRGMDGRGYSFGGFGEESRDEPL